MANILTRARNILTPGETAKDAEPIDNASEIGLTARVPVEETPDGSDTPSVADQQALTVPATIDPTEIQHPILTEKGWLVPEPKA